MYIFFEGYQYNKALLDSILGENRVYIGNNESMGYTDRIGYLFVTIKEYTGPVFILPKSFLIDINGQTTVLGIDGVLPEDVIDTLGPSNPLDIKGMGSFLPELSLWLYRALDRFRTEHEGTTISQHAELDSQLPDDGARDKDFLRTALDLIDFLKDHRNLFTQISLINHSGNNRIDWAKTVTGDPFIENGEAWYLDPAIKQKAINIDDTLIILYYSVLKYLRDKYNFPVNLGEVPYDLLTVTDVQYLIDTGIGSKRMKRIRHNYFRDDLKHLWGLLDSFFTYNISEEDREKRKEHLLVKDFEIVFEAMVDRLVTDTRGVEALKKQDDGHLIDHIFRFTSLIGRRSDIYYIGDSKYYADTNRPKGVALYKQFAYAKNDIQYHIDEMLFQQRRGHWPPKGKNALRYRDTLTEGYNISPNFFIRSRVTENDTVFNEPALEKTIWDKKKRKKYPDSNKHFEDRLFDRDTLVLREFSINLLFVIAAYAGYEDTYWNSDLHRTIRQLYIETVDDEYQFYIVKPHNINILLFDQLYTQWLNGKTYTLDESDDYLILAFEKTPQGDDDLAVFRSQRLRNVETGEEVTYDFMPTTLRELDTVQ